ncbi:LexA family transcriptional regulator [Brevibacillus halotolerans]|uniref:LexA family transcriptional regulator n=1 Tax=Brevibacillus TaxID=55080 RepID=UPI00215BB929|nr:MULTISPECIES: LexA family transcriptional regulator [Brevibacillus]MCR8963940.1 LexA family transcriptional regulator [Brevibacillus laterosporus]MCZ0836095.1 LexA family transcriptional regulator [Brevibacillus halotolerans]
MGYYDLLDEMLKKSGLTLQEIADRCERDFGVKINRSYISKLKTVRQSPASDEINEAIARVCGANVEEFLYEAYLEKAPDSMKSFIKNLIKVTRELNILAYKNNVPNDKLSVVEAHFNQLSDFEFMKEISKFSDSFTEFKIQKIDELEDKEHIGFSKQIYDIKMEDNSMEPTIPEGAIIHIDSKANIKAGDIVFVSFVEGDYQIKRYYPNIEEYYEGEDYQIIFTSDNPIHEPIAVNASDVKLLRKITSYTSTEKLGC